LAIQQQTELSVTEALQQKADLHYKLSKNETIDINAAQQAANATKESMDEFDKTLAKDPIAKRAAELASAEKQLQQRLKLTTQSDSEKYEQLAQQ